MPAIYGSPDYAMGDDELVVAEAANAPVTRAHAQRAQVELRRMRGALKRWLHFRALNDQVAAGQPVRATLRRPGSRPMPPAAMALALGQQRAQGEAELAKQVHALLSEVFDAGELPAPTAPNAVLLARIAIEGKLPGDLAQPSAQGAGWVWPVVIIVGAIAFVITTHIRSTAEREAERERYECIRAGACTDTGFWLKAAGVVFLGWFVWEKAGLKHKFAGGGGARSS